MYIDKREISKSVLKKIILKINIILGIVFVFLLFAFWNTQVLKHYFYKNLALQNIYKDIELKAPRGFILDRNLHILAENKINFSLFIIKEHAKDFDKSIEIASELTGISKADLLLKIDRYKGYPKSYPIPIKKDFSLKNVIYLSSRSDEFPEFEINIEPARTYPGEKSCSHVLGYLSELTSTELEKKGTDYSLGDLIGRSGIEFQYEKYLRGKKGVNTIVRDNMGVVQEVIGEEKPIIGDTIILTLDNNLQLYVENVMENLAGCIGIVDLKTGGILTMVSKPNFDPEILSGQMDKEEWVELVNDPEKPLHNKFLQGLYSPGSVFKIVIALAALQEKEVNLDNTVFCNGVTKIFNRNFHCWQARGHGTVGLYDAIKYSCNIFFYQLGKRLDIDVIANYSNMLGLGVKTGIDMPNEKSGRVPTKAWKLNTFKQKWFPGETISVAIGGGMLSITPIQLLMMISTVALRGKMPDFHILDRVERDGKTIMQSECRFKEVAIKKEYFEIVINGLFRVVNEGGTGRSAKVDLLNVCGKTGTQQVISKENPNYKVLVKQDKFKPHSWFVSFAPKDDPKIAMVVFIENGGDAGAIAAPIAGKIYKYIMENERHFKIL